MICSKEKCLGCFACVNSCPVKCIEMNEDIYGNIYPVIDQEKCINCNLCKKSCPINVDIKASTPYKCFAAWSNEEEERETSTSGGVASALSRYIIDKGGAVYGAVINCETLRVEHRRINDINNANKLKKSKYVHSYINESYSLAKEDLENDKLVLFTGTPCQIAGLKSFLKKDYDNLFTLDIVCHGVPNQKFLLEYIESFGKIEDYDDYSFRDNNEYMFSLMSNGKILKKTYYRESEYIMGFLMNVIQRENCFSCPYAQEKRVSDITIGDFWGLGDKTEFRWDKSGGVSAILINTQKGRQLVQNVSNELFLVEREVQEAVKGNTQLRCPAVANQKRDRFLKLYLNRGLKKGIRNVLFKDFFKYRIKKIIKKNCI